MGATCPVCGDLRAYPLWAGRKPPEACPDDSSWHDGGAVTIRNVSECPSQMARAWQAAERRRLCPNAFDANGNILPGQIARVLQAYVKAHPGEPLKL